MLRRKFACHTPVVHCVALCRGRGAVNSMAPAFAPMYSFVLQHALQEHPGIISSHVLTHTVFVPPTSYIHSSTNITCLVNTQNTSLNPYKRTLPRSNLQLNPPHSPYHPVQLNSTQHSIHPNRARPKNQQCASATSPTGDPAIINAAPASTFARTPKRTRALTLLVVRREKTFSARKRREESVGCVGRRRARGG